MRSNVAISYDGKTLILRSLDDDVDVRDVKRAFVNYVEPLKVIFTVQYESVSYWLAFAGRGAAARGAAGELLLPLQVPALR